MVASLTPWRLATSATLSLSASRRIRTICSSLYRVFFICLSLSERPLSQVTLDRKSRDRSDFYHVPVLHVKSFGSRVRWSNDGVELNKLGGSTINYTTSPSTPGGLPLLGKMPWLEHEDVTLGRAGYLQPSLSMFARIDYAGPMVIWPIDETHCEVWIYRLFPEDVFQR